MDRQGDDHFVNYLISCDYATWLTRTRCLSIHGNLEEDSAWNLIAKFTQNSKDIEFLRLSSRVSVAKIFKWLTFPNLRWLKVEQAYAQHTNDAELKPERQRVRTAPFTSLSLLDFKLGPRIVTQFVQWPALLTHFEFEIGYNGSEYQMNYPMFESWLLIHKDTLRHVHIGPLSSQDSSPFFNATLFPNLAYLSLSAWPPRRDSSDFTTQAMNLLGSRLKTFRWDFTVHDQHTEQWDDFGPMESDWLRALGIAAVERKAALETVIIQFKPDEYSDEFTEYPYDLMDSLQSEVFGPNGMSIVYPQPIISKDDWLKQVRSRGEGRVEIEDEPVGDEPECYHGEDIRRYFLSRLST
ncbi:hypothetical protein GQ44DRAFT_800464 [Phaeosphaeriaceae sp. PMI808]|nr:hypothetical protein GQ44DRAFT_800464 [Phaeosphaeriaceae sp. PMI808]